MTPAIAPRHFDVVVVGGGLAGQLTALALRTIAPARTVALVDRSLRLGSNTTWCCHRSDLQAPWVGGAPLSAWFLALVDARWPKHEVRFPRYRRVLDWEYLCLRSSSLAARTEAALSQDGSRLFLGEAVSRVGRHEVGLESGGTLTAHLVLDARGLSAEAYEGRAGYQKFVGWEIDLSQPSADFSAWPTLMDATVRQVDGFRFMYVLPFTATRILVEDTVFSRRAGLDVELFRARLQSYVAKRAGAPFRILREESGVLPMPWSEPAHAVEARDAGLAIGYRGRFFHPGTGYSLSRAALVACRVAECARDGNSSDFSHVCEQAMAALRAAWSPDDAFARRLNRLVFTWLPPTWLREMIFSPVYRLPESVLGGFYAGRTRLRDRLALATAPVRFSMFRPVAKPLSLLGGNP